MSFNKPIWWARDAVGILRQNGSNEHADAVITVCDKHAELEAELAEAREDGKRLATAGQAVVDRWDSPKWKDQDPTAKVINELRAAIDAARGRK